MRTLFLECLVGVLLACGTSLTAAQSQIDLPRSQRVPAGSLIEDLAGGLGATLPSGVRPLVPLAPELIMAFEGWEPSPYDDPSGYCTIGFGRLIKKSKCAEIDLSAYPRPLTSKEGAEFLEEDTRTARSAVQRLVKRDLSDHQFGALTSFVFNVGKDQFAKSTLLLLVNNGYFDAAAKEFGKWILSRKKVLPGLIARRSCEAALFRNLLKPNTAGEFVRSTCDQLGIAPTSGTLIDIATGEEVQASDLK
ncbi:lysozyme [Aquincola sp. J276]|uniref:lysozyme n=1 Tax=Aquincola sp. J276 TaxID=2898432 RepID=UPI00215175DF|nr:lysozyme [Aquincola sp. J276]MCR5867729.1 lysozyme [Aquincola sp. J276]